MSYYNGKKFFYILSYVSGSFNNELLSSVLACSSCSSRLCMLSAELRPTSSLPSSYQSKWRELKGASEDFQDGWSTKKVLMRQIKREWLQQGFNIFFFCLLDRKKDHMVYWPDVLFLLVKAVSLLLGSFCLIRFTLKAMAYLLQGLSLDKIVTPQFRGVR